MKKIMKHFAVLAAFAVIVAGCGNKGASGSDPKSVLTEFFKRLGAKDIEGAAKLATAESQTMMNMMKSGMEMAEKMKDKMNKEEKDEMEDFKDVEFGDAVINGETATVPVRNKKKNETVDFPLKKEGGDWKVDFSMNTMMKMASDQMEKEGNTEEAEKLKNMDPAQLQKIQDSLNKYMDPKQLEKMQEAIDKAKKDAGQ